MKCRRFKTWTDENNIEHRDIVWFGSYGIHEDGTAKFYNKNNIHDNYSEKQQAIIDCLTQKLSVIRNELWYKMSYGLPLFEKYKSKGVIDTYIMSVVLSQKNVKSFISFNSVLNKNNYSCQFTILSDYGNITLSI